MNSGDIKSSLLYDEISGKFKRIKKGKIKVGTTTEEGYLRINVNGKLYLAHRLAWMIHYGKMPKMEIDHIDGNRLNNSIKNLREVTSSQNSKNAKIPITNTSGTIGVSWNKKCKKWSAQIKIEKKSIHLGTFVEYSDAVNARKNAEVLYGFHKNHGRI